MAIDPEKEEFLREFGEDYGYPNAPKNIDELRATEFKRLDDVAYLDHAGATLYSESQMEAIFKDFNSTIYGNPHSQSDCSVTTSNIVDDARRQVLNFFNASPREYKCIFTSGATAALKLVGETFPWSSQSTFMYTMENHNSVLGIREYALNGGAAAFSVDVEEVVDHDQPDSGKSAFKIIPHQEQRRSEHRFLKKEATGDTYNLFAFPSECNFSGLRFNLDLVNFMKEDLSEMFESSTHHRGNWMVIIDAAKGSTTAPPDLSKYKADFVVVSFYKLFGYPTGLGALIVQNEAAKLMKKTYFSGGTVAASIADIDFFKRREGVEEYFEDGTISFLSIASLHHGFKILNALTMTAISRHASSLATYVRNKLLDLRHANGHHVCTLYGLRDSEVLCNKMGPTVSFNLRRPEGSWFGYREVEKLASLSGVQLRTGCFCNPGACAKYLGLSHSDLLSNVEAGHICWDDRDIMNGKPTGAVRVSFGYMSTFGDARKFLRFIENGFVVLPPVARAIHPVTEDADKAIARYFLKSITIYPIKSCAGFSVESWPLTRTGLLHDREWLLKSLNGEILTQKKVPDMCYITASIDLNLEILCVESPRCKEKLQIKLKSDPTISEKEEMKIYSQRYEVQASSDEVDNWFSKAVGRHCTLIRNTGSQSHSCPIRDKSPGICRDIATSLNFVNEAQFLLISEESVADLNNRLRSKLQNGSHEPPTEVTSMRFRPNLVMSGGKPYIEDEWRNLKIGDNYFSSLGGCNRCQMINMTSSSGEVHRSNEPLATLASYRRVKGKICFGILLRYEDSTEHGAWLHVGQEIYANVH
ncbi:molybdenum cofactor sulfurase isoform X2 [Olea europaea var. sylvestris]|uniref:molybdenum cofactor sulfurase isoform X2 n=1 Tax=Olea europaea var. sylvestris TaxID=158386 RepID=UPI000C1D2F45|nr:molybdenum cofactor sulfurase isoform X2 [Olea europaea var. sylvestris]